MLDKKMDAMKISPKHDLKDLKDAKENDLIRTRGFIYNQRVKGKRSFMIIRDSGNTIQCMYSLKPHLNEEKYKILTQVPLESFIEITGEILKTSKPILACSIKNIEIEILDYKVINKIQCELPFSIKDASMTEEARENNPDAPKVSYNKQLDFKILDLRTPQSYSIFKVVDGTMFFFREFLRNKGFMEIKTSKLIETASEGGANVFAVDYFKGKAYLAQSPQLYKQMAIIGGLKRVYEIGHVYRAEESNINRYLSEFTGLDLEMEIDISYTEVIHLIYSMLIYIFDNLKKDYSQEIENIRAFKHFQDLRYNPEPIVLTHKECVELLRKAGFEQGEMDDFNRENEKRLGEIIAEKYGVDIFVCKEYPTNVRAFYTSAIPESPQYSRSYDFIIRGEEILSGAQRIDNYDILKESAKRCGVNEESIRGYLESFKYGAPPHGGCGIGMERLLKAFFNFNDIRYFNMFPRDPGRLNP
ncbi:putative aspartate--tRNA ligase, cytoplasmic [Astathelohania contejeani]|uniref:aspartate--tRNA ligase n=1 Tax=Astathelohania contejeani TaxID=164912 RepID=A0ABQ7HW63_9MICR|nr:putative aspartate--tRNA ligase, cytoplasmic [Thelohania contejeani]